MSGVVRRKVHKVNAKVRSKDPSSCQDSFAAKVTKLMQKLAAKTRRHVKRVVCRKVHKVNAKVGSKDPSSCQESFAAKVTKLIAKIRIKELGSALVVTSSCARLAISSFLSVLRD